MNEITKKKKLKKEIKDTLKESIRDFFSEKEVKTVHPLDLIFPKERRIRSLIGGLETSLGTKVWEPLAKTFAKNNGFEVLDEKEYNASVPLLGKKILHKLSDFKDKKRMDNKLLCSEYFDEIKNITDITKKPNNNFIKIPKGEGVDIWLKKDNIEYLIDIKTTQVNAGSGPKFLENLLKWYSYSALQGTEDLQCFIGFPFNPHKSDFWKKEGGKIAPLMKNNEAYVGDNFWDMLSGMNETTKFIFNVFKELGEEDFGGEFNDIFAPK